MDFFLLTLSVKVASPLISRVEYIKALNFQNTFNYWQITTQQMGRRKINGSITFHFYECENAPVFYAKLVPCHLLCKALGNSIQNLPASKSPA